MNLFFPSEELLDSKCSNLPLRGLALMMNGIRSPGSSQGPHSAVFCPLSTKLQEEMGCWSGAGRLPVIGLPVPAG